MNGHRSVGAVTTNSSSKTRGHKTIDSFACSSLKANMYRHPDTYPEQAVGVWEVKGVRAREQAPSPLPSVPTTGYSQHQPFIHTLPMGVCPAAIIMIIISSRVRPP
ncbi:hypothetical protein Ddc_07667 [Ditylenchus destructor]|nr:hypothetical protein Ddc_07667 [Ditylenchus destructor]